MTTLKFKIDEIENLESIQNPKRFIDSDFPVENYIKNLESGLNEDQIIAIAKMVIIKLQYNVLSVAATKAANINIFQWNVYSDKEFINEEFYDLLASVFDYIERHDKTNITTDDSEDIKFISEAIDSTIESAIVVLVKKIPEILDYLDGEQRKRIEAMVDATAQTVKEMDQKKQKMNPVLKMCLMKNIMNADSASFNPEMTLLLMKQKGDLIDPDIEKMLTIQCAKMTNDPMRKVMWINSLKGNADFKAPSPATRFNNQRSNQFLHMMNGGGLNPMNTMGNMANMNPMQKTMAIMNMMQNNNSGSNVGNNAQRQMALHQNLAIAHQQQKMQMLMDITNNNTSSKTESVNTRLRDNPPNPELAELYNKSQQVIDPASDTPHEDPRLEQFRQKMLLAAEQQSQFDEMVMAFEQPDISMDDGDGDVDLHLEDKEMSHEDWVNGDELDSDDIDERRKRELIEGAVHLPDFYDEYEDEDEREQGVVVFDEVLYRNHRNVFQGDPLDVNLPNIDEGFPEGLSGETLPVSVPDNKNEEMTKEEREEAEVEKLRHKRIHNDQKLVIKKFFNDKVPEGVKIIDVDGVDFYAFTPKQLFSGSYKLEDTIKAYIARGENPPAAAGALPLTIKGKNKVISILTSDGIRGDIILPDIGEDENMEKMETHIPPKAIIDWNKLRKDPIIDENGEVIVNNHLVTMENELTGTINSTSITANCYAISTEEIDLTNSENKVIEYQTSSPTGFYVENAHDIIDNFGVESDVTEIHQLIGCLNSYKVDHPAIIGYIDNHATNLINDYLHYSMGVDLTIDSFMEDYEELIKVVKDAGKRYFQSLRGYENELINAVCTAVRGDTVIDLDTVEGTLSKEEEVDGNVETVTVDFDGSDLDKNLIVFKDKSHVIELPWTIDELALGFTKPIASAKPFVLISNTDEYEDIYPAIKEVADRANIDSLARSAVIVTKDRTELIIKQSAYEHGVFILVKDN